MPRKAPSRTGAGGNRTDVGVPPMAAQASGQPNGASRQPVMLPTGAPYGDRQNLQQAQQAAPLPQNAQQPPDLMAMALQAARQGVPGKSQRPMITPLNAPTERPNEPLTEGMGGSFGTGTPATPGLAAPGTPPQGPPQSGIAQLLQQMAAQTGSSKLSQLAQRAAAGN